jgi:oligopeptide transport system substrate-binding protein
MLKRLLLAGGLALALAAPAFADAVKQGGTLTITYKDDFSTLDPAIGYDWANWSPIKSLFSRLLDYKPGTTEIVPDLAESYEVSPDGLTYTFHLRHGVKFSNGRELTATDVKYSFDRVTNPKTQSPGASFFKSIKGFDDIQGGKTDSLAGVTVVDPYTVRIDLAKPDATFTQVCALNFSGVVPKEEVDKYGADFGHHVVSSGPYNLTEWTLGQRIVFERNKDFYVPGLPYLDKIVFEIGQEPLVALLRLQKGEIDIPGDNIPPAKFLEVMSDPTWSKQVIHAPQLMTGYVTMNVEMKPFDDVRVRKAVNMAINKDRIIKIINGRAVPAVQPLPPGMPGFDKDYKGYAYDVDKAKALMKDAGYADGVDTELYVYNTDPNPRIAQAIQQDLAAIGIRAQIKSLDQANVIAAGGTEKTAAMIWSGGMAWIADFPDPSDFYGPILGCGGAVKGGWNWSWYCNKDREAEAAKADAMVKPEEQAARAELWRSIFIKIMQDDAPWAPVFHEEHYTIHSTRIGGPDAVFNDPVHIPINYNAVYATDVQ